MSKTKHMIYQKSESTVINAIFSLIRAGLVSGYANDTHVIIGRHGTNKTELKKILKNSVEA